MKKMLFGLVATVMCISIGHAQKISNEELRQELSKSMSSLVTDLKSSYKAGMSYKDFKSVILAGSTNSTIPTTGDNLLKKAHYFLENKTSNEKIISTYTGEEMADAYYILKDSKDAKSGASKIFGEEVIEKTKFGQNLMDSRVTCCKWLLDAFSWIWDHKTEIIDMICIFTSIC